MIDSVQPGLDRSQQVRSVLWALSNEMRRWRGGRAPARASLFGAERLAALGLQLADELVDELECGAGVHQSSVQKGAPAW